MESTQPPPTLVSRFNEKCARLRATVDYSTDQLGQAHTRQMGRDVETLTALRSDISRLKTALGRLDEDVRPTLERLARAEPHTVLPRPPTVKLVKAPTAAEEAAAAMVQALWRKRKHRLMASSYHCPALLRRRFVEGAHFYATAGAPAILHPAKELAEMRSEALHVPMSAEELTAVQPVRHFMSIL